MKCFYHGEVDAVALCKSCGHALCHDCCAEVGTGSACRNRCEGEVEALNDMIQRNKSAFTKASSVYVRSGIFVTTMGLVFAGLGAYNWMHNDRFLFMPILGVLFLLYGLSQFGAARRYRAK